MSTPGEVRIGDADRERAQSTLSDHYAAGRLDHDEYSERLDRIWAARTRAELDPVFTDLPGTAASTAASYPYSTPSSRRPAAVRTRSSRPPVPLLILLVVLGTIAIATHLPIILVGLGVWFFFFRGGSCRSPHRQR